MALLSPGKDGLFTPADPGSVMSAPAAWTGIDTRLKAARAAYINGPAETGDGAAGPSSPEAVKHWLLILLLP
ncbi:hypothetical protein ACIA8F_35025 [Streptomyces sp. NPDC051563]|uniref:hypothetical protein n=1 Tax=Streptomyces sp. NPDC051563 TaxID=3365659 RepID=UPI0037AEEDE2